MDVGEHRRSVALGAGKRVLALGPRTRRRLRVGGVAAAGIVAAVGAFLIIHHSSKGSGSDTPRHATSHGYASLNARATHLYYGMTPHQVQHFAGRAHRIRAGCWFYTPIHTNAGTKVGALNVGVPGTPSMTSDQIKLCFYAGVLSFEYTHVLVPNQGREWVPAEF